MRRKLCEGAVAFSRLEMRSRRRKKKMVDGIAVGRPRDSGDRKPNRAGAQAAAVRHKPIACPDYNAAGHSPHIADRWAQLEGNATARYRREAVARAKQITFSSCLLINSAEMAIPVRADQRQRILVDLQTVNNIVAFAYQIQRRVGTQLRRDQLRRPDRCRPADCLRNQECS